MEYRVDVFSYPNARGLNGSSNFAIHDQRAAVEWVSRNIEAFGGDPDQLTLWGQSAGAGLTDQYLFAWPTDPSDYSGSNFTLVAEAMGCDFEDAALELQCMRRVPMPRLVGFVGQWQDNSTTVHTSQPTITFTRIADDKFIFNNSQYISKYENGQIARIPKIVGTTARESAPTQWTTIPPAHPKTSYTLRRCRLSALPTTTAYFETKQDSPLIVPWLGAYHYADRYMFFGTYPMAPGPIPAFEVETSEKMQDLLYEFINDPTCLPFSGWPHFNASASDGGQLACFGAHGEALQLVDGNDVDGACHIPGAVYETTP
ncbi:hypothetical protein LTR56_018065 [Elasticomyces elasticus]|nr:hypothetical protein LTR56_018065 [Elasticomyces elasticus]KAK3639536.1 hypothetical protein LTR22_017398 [Elasticomyces elasticus]KAK4913188.1 hypothetical protein LTR49_018462 [Elasticomyces elasticus]KAK5752770.1 hypothetical protein LTS12_017153 [Elasticomyces elasticus]